MARRRKHNGLPFAVK